MTYATQCGRAVTGFSVWQRLSRLTSNPGERWAQQQAYRSTVRELRASSHRELTDMGVHPADLQAIARHATYGA